MEEIKDSRKNTYQDESVFDSQNILEVLFKYLRQWKLCLVIVLVSLLIGVVYTFTSSRKYEVSSSVSLIEDKKKSGTGSSLSGLEDLGLLSTTNNIDNEIAIFTSPDLMNQVVRLLEIQTTYTIKEKLRTVDIYNQSPYLVKLQNDSLLLKNGRIEVHIQKEGTSYNIEGTEYPQGGENKDFSKKGVSLPIAIDVFGGKTQLIINTANSDAQNSEFLNKKIHATVESSVSTADRLCRSLSVSPVTKAASILNLKLIVNNSTKGKDILDTLIKQYNKDNIEDKNKTAINTSLFINERLSEIYTKLDTIERNVEHYKRAQGITNLTAETQLYMQQSGVNEQKRIEVETQSRVLDMVEKFVLNPANKDKTIPNIGITDPGLSEMITQYNSTLLAKDKLGSVATENNPTRQKLELELSSMREGIFNSLLNVRKSVQITLRNIDQEIGSTASKLLALPMQERGLLEKTRQQQIQESLYLFLLQKGLETNITVAAATEKAKVVIAPRSGGAVAPKTNIILLASFIIGLVIFVAYIYLKELLNIRIGNRDELEKLSIVPVIGQIQESDEPDAVVVHKNSSTSNTELFRSLRNNIEFMMEDDSQKIILVTSTIAGEGKTFVAVNLACSFALSEKKVLLVGMDVRNPQIANTFNMGKGYGLTDYLSGGVSDWKPLLVNPITESPNLDVLQAGTIPPNPNELLKKPILADFLKEARSIYDIIIIDSAPVGIISDTYILGKYPDFTLYVTRERYTHKSAVSFINTQYEEKRLNRMYLVLNASSTKTDNYKYGYGQTYGYAKKSSKKE